ncbi:hypothetical protein JS562_53565, partial [Agrobacterium sp. S2]|nr:hypothetical protein [Agrobacterium sp. S2]
MIADTIQGPGDTPPVRLDRHGWVFWSTRARSVSTRTGGDPVDVMLDHVVDLLEPDGVLVLAIENQMGLKYLAGFPEDHLGSRMVGVEDRYGKDTAVTFGRRELDNRLARAGLTHQSWFYPFPDYKLPVSVLAESALDPATGFDPVPIIAPALRNDPQEPELTTFDLALSARPVVRNQLLADLA